MTTHLNEPKSNKKQKRKKFPWVLGTVISAVILAIITFTIAAFLILHNQGTTQGISTLTIISIVFGVVISLLGLMLSFLQWHHPKVSVVPETFNVSQTEPQVKLITDSATEASAFFDQSTPSTQLTLSSTINHPVFSDASLGLPDSQVSKVVNMDEDISIKMDWGEAPYIGQFYGRDKELAELEKWIVREQCRVVAVFGIGGIGKSTFAVKLAERIMNLFDYVSWLSLKNAPPFESTLKHYIQILSNQQQVNLPEDLDSQITRLIEFLGAHRCLLIFDNIETILQSGDSTGHYLKGYEGYGRLIQRIGDNPHRSCLLLTSREKLKEVIYTAGETSPVRVLQLIGLGQAEGQELLKDKGLFGSIEVWEALIHLYSGNPLALKLASEPIRELFGGDIVSFLKVGKTVFGDIRDPLELQFTRLSRLEREILYWLAINRDAVSLNDLREDIVQSLSDGNLLASIGDLRRRYMIEIYGIANFILQPVIMEYVTDRFIEEVYDEIDTETIVLFGSHSIIKAQAKDYIRESQTRLILTPIAERLLSNLGKEETEKKLQALLSIVKTNYLQNVYAAGNILNLLLFLKCEILGFDFSQLIVRQAYLQGAKLQDVNFAYSDLAKCVFTETFGNVLAVAFSPEGVILAAGTTRGEIRLWHTTTGTPIFTIRGHIDWVRSIAFSPDGKTLVSCGEDQTICLWEVSTGQCLHILRGHTDRVWSVAFSPDGCLLASTGDEQNYPVVGSEYRTMSACSPGDTQTASTQLPLVLMAAY